MTIFPDVSSASAVGHLFNASSRGSRIIYFFCQFDNAESLSPFTIISSLIRQCLDAETLSQSLQSRLVDLLKFPGPELCQMGVLLSDVLGFNKASFIIVDAIDDCKKSERGIILRLFRDVMASCLSVVKLFFAVRQGMVQEVGNIFKSCYETTMSSSEAHLSIRTYIKEVLAEKKENKDLIVGNPELFSQIQEALTEEANGM